MRGGGSSEMAVYEFAGDELAVEAQSSNYSARFQTGNDGSALDKYSFLHNFPDKKQIDDKMCIDNREAEMDDDVAPQFNSMMQFSADYDQHLTSHENEENDSWQSESEPSASPCSDEPENNGYFEQHGYDDYYTSSHREVIVKEGEIMLWPYHVTCGSAIYIEPVFTFSSDGIKIEGKDSEEQDYEIEWSVDDIFHISCKWNATAKSASMKILVRHDNGSGKTCLSIVFSAAQWQEKEYIIKNLSPRYMEIWNSVLIDENSSDDDGFFPKHYFNRISENFEEVIYPKGDPDAVSISKRDVDLLLPETFINDTIIDFYIKYLNNNIPEMKRKRLHFFNSFFFRKLADLDKDQGKTTKGRAAFLRVKKWTRKTNIFEKDFIFIPVNFNLHWSLLVICNPGEIRKVGEKDTRECEKVPCVLHMDSLKGNHSGLKDIIQSYLWEEWKEKNPNCTEDYSSKFLDLRFVSLDLPQQDNCFDCGLFLLHYVEVFLEDAPLHFSPFKIPNSSSFLKPDWFPPADGSLKRSVIRKLIYGLLHETCTKNGIISQQNDEMELDQEETGLELLSQEPCGPSVPVITSVCQLNLDATGDDNELERIESIETVHTHKTTCILEDDEEWEKQRACTSVSAEMNATFESLNSQSQTSRCQISSPNQENLLEESEKLLEDSAEPAIVPDIPGYAPDTPILSPNETTLNNQNVGGENENVGLIVPETPIISLDDVEKSNSLQNAVVPGTPMVDSSSVEALETPVASKKEDGEKEKLGKCDVSKEVFVLDSPVASQKEGEKKGKEEKCVLSKEVFVLESPVASQKEDCGKGKGKEQKCGLPKELFVQESPVASQKEDGKGKEQKHALSKELIVLESPVAAQKEGEKEKPREIPLETPVLSGDNAEKEKKIDDPMQIEKEEFQLEAPVDEKERNGELETPVEKKEEFVNLTVEMESSKESSFRVSSEDILISDDEGSVEQTPRKKRRKEFNIPEGSRRLTRSSLKGSAR